MAKELPELFKLYYKVGGGYSIIGKKKDFTEAQADEIIRRCKAEPKLRRLLRYAFELPQNEAGNFEENVKWQEETEQALSEEKQDGGV